MGEGRLESYLEEWAPIDANVNKAKLNLMEARRNLSIASDEKGVKVLRFLRFLGEVSASDRRVVSGGRLLGCPLAPGKIILCLRAVQRGTRQLQAGRLAQLVREEVTTVSTFSLLVSFTVRLL